MDEDTSGISSLAPASSSSSSSSSVSQVHHSHEEQIDEVDENNQTLYQRPYIYVSDAASGLRQDFCSFLFVLLPLLFFASMIMILGSYGAVKLPLGPYTSFLVQANPLFVQSIEVRETNGPTHSVQLFEFYEPPPLDVEINWSEIHDEFVQSGHQVEWPYFLNEGSKIDVSYTVNAAVSAALFLVIAKGKTDILRWAEDPSYPNTALSWNIIHGKGMIQQDISSSGIYYIALGNFNSEEVKVQLNFTMKANVYNTSQAYYRCYLSHDKCSLKLSLINETVAVLTSPGPDQAKAYDNGFVELSYGPRWITFFVGSCFITVLSILASGICTMLRTHLQARETRSEQNSSLLQKDDDCSSWDSAYDSMTNEEEEELDKLLAAASSLDGKQTTEKDNIDSLRCRCVVCFHASRDCFFLPCGHSAACFTCGKRIIEDAGNCPICHRKAKKVRQIINV